MARIVKAEVNLDDWIDGDASFLQVQVDLYPNRKIYSELAPLAAQIEVAEQRLAQVEAAARPVTTDGGDDEQALDGSSAKGRVPAGEHALDETPAVPPAVASARAELDDLIAQAEAVYARYEDSRETWTLRELDQENEIVPIVARHPHPDGAPPARRSKETARAFEERMRAYIDGYGPVRDAVNEECVALAVVSVEKGGKQLPFHGIDTLRRLRARPHGQRHFAQLVAALEDITSNEVVMPTPHRRGA